jgi:hypothetical protein
MTLGNGIGMFAMIVNANAFFNSAPLDVLTIGACVQIIGMFAGLILCCMEGEK